MKKSILILIISVLVSMVVVIPAGASPVTLSVDPPSIIDLAMVPPATFSIDVTVKDVTDLYGFEFMLNYTTAVLTANEITLGPLFPPGAWEVATEIDNTTGYVRYMVTLPYGSESGVSGSGTLATIAFTVEGHGGSKLDLCNTLLGDSSKPPKPINHTVIDGYFSNVPRPKVFVDPESIVNPDLISGKNFTINVKVFNATDLNSFEFKLNYDTALLDVDVTEGGFLNSSGLTNFTLNINETLGFVLVNVTLLDPLAGATGDGTLAKVSFNVTAIGECLLDLCETNLVDSAGTLIEHYEPVDGYFNNKPIVHDVAITKVTTTRYVTEHNVTFAATVSQVYVGEKVNITVLVKNNGTEPESFNVTVYYDNTQIKNETLTDFLADTSTTLTFEWNTEDVAVSDYTIWAEASVVAGETNTANNKLTKEGKFAVLGHTFPTELVVAPIVLIIAAAIIVYFIKIRKPKPA